MPACFSRLAAISLSLAVPAWFVPHPAAAMTCEQYVTSSEAYDQAALVFMGTAAQQKATADGRAVETLFTVDYFWKGFAPQTVMVSRSAEGSHDARFQTGRRYLVEGHPVEGSSLFYANSCGNVQDLTGQNVMWSYFSFVNRRHSMPIFAVAIMLGILTLKGILSWKRK